MSTIDEKLAHLSPEKRRLVLARLKAKKQAKQTGPATEKPALESVTRDQELPLSYAQEGMWFLDRLEPGPIYNIFFARRFRGRFDGEALEQALQVLINRHESFRTVFPDREDVPYQHILDAKSFRITLFDLTTCQSGLRLLLDRLHKRVFNLGRGPLLHAALIRLDASTHVLVICMHHIISDGWSLGIFFRELAAVYRARLYSECPHLPKLQFHYADYAHWQRRYLVGDEKERQLSYWKEQLAGIPNLLTLPADHVRPARCTYAGSVDHLLLEAPSMSQITQLGRTRRATPFMVLQAAFTTLLARYSGTQDIVLGIPVATRAHAGLASVIGLFVNTLAIRTRVDEHTNFATLIDQVRQQSLEAFEHQELPFERLVEALQPERDLRRHPLFQVMFNYAAEGEMPELEGLEQSQLDADNEANISKFDLTLTIQESQDRLAVSANYSTDLFEKRTIERMLRHYRHILVALTKAPQQPINQASQLDVEDRQRLLELMGLEKQDHDLPDRFVHQLFEAQVVKSPDQIALIMDDGRSLTYGELNRRANQQAHYLRQRGVTGEVVVGLYLERTPAMVVAQIASFKCGGVYMPLATELPQERIAFMIQDSGAAVIISDTARRQATTVEGIIDIHLDRDSAEIETCAEHNPELAQSPNQLAYIIYTSGSTGRPKAVMLTHGTLASHILSTAKKFKFGEHSRVYQFTSFNFDPSLEQMWTTFICGARLVMRGPEVPEPRLLCQKILDWGLTHLGLTPAYWQQLVEQWHEQGLTEIGELETVTTGGDVIPPEGLKRWLQTELNQIQLYNAYGPTETVITSTYFPIPKGYQIEGSIPIGRPLANRTINITDRSGYLVPVGAPGQLQIGGQLLARGYHKWAGLTAQQFVPDPYTTVKGSRLYQSGDLVRYDFSGNLVFLGRVDQQVKIRGYRIELLEIEAILAQYEHVAEAVVQAPQDEHGQKFLIGYLVPDQKGMEDVQLIEAVRQWVKAKLPSYMIPTTFMCLQSLPLNASGKLDRRALPKPVQHQASREKVGPRNTIELQLLSCWQQALPSPCMSIHDNFFEQGGHSMTALKLLGLIEKSIHVQLSITHIFQYPTVAELAHQLETKTVVPTILVPIKPAGRGRPWYFVHPVGGHVHCYFELAQAMARPFYGIQSPKPEEIPESLAALAGLYIEQIKSHQPEGPYLLGGWSLGGTIAFEMARQLEDRGERVEQLALVDAWRLEREELLPRDEDEHLRQITKELTGGREFAIDQILAERGGRDHGTLLAAIHEQLLGKGLISSELPITYVVALYRTFKRNARLVADSPAPTEYGGEVAWIQATLTLSARQGKGMLGWQHFCKKKVAISQVTCDHDSILTGERATETAAYIERSDIPD